jgi:hypothetical protein
MYLWVESYVGNSEQTRWDAKTVKTHASAEVKNTWSYTTIPPYASGARCLIKQK